MELLIRYRTGVEVFNLCNLNVDKGVRVNGKMASFVYGNKMLTVDTSYIPERIDYDPYNNDLWILEDASLYPEPKSIFDDKEPRPYTVWENHNQEVSNGIK